MEDQARATGHVLMACPPKDSCSPCGKRSDPALLFHDADMHEALEFLVSDRCLAEAVTDATFMEPLTDGNFYGSCRAQAEQELTCEKGSMLDPPCVADHTAIRSHFGSLNSDFSVLDDPLHALQSPTGPCLGSDDEGVFPGATGIELLTTDEVDLDGTGMVGLVPQVPPLQVQCAQLPCCADNMLCHGRTGAGVGTAGTLRPSSRTSSTPSSLLSISSVFSGGGSGGAVPHSSHAVGDDHSPHASRNTSCHSSVRTGTGANADASCFEAAADAESGGAGDRGGEGEMPMRTLTRPRRAAALMLSQLANSRNKKRGGAGSTARKLAPNPHGQACTACGATSTPVWRYGPQGPKTLCNACGVRYMKVAKSRR